MNSAHLFYKNLAFLSVSEFMIGFGKVFIFEKNCETTYGIKIFLLGRLCKNFRYVFSKVILTVKCIIVKVK